VIFHEHICEFDLGCVEVLSRDQKLHHATAPFLAPLRDYIANLLGESAIQNWEFRLYFSVTREGGDATTFASVGGEEML
jgi:hypothetical protein